MVQIRFAFARSLPMVFSREIFMVREISWSWLVLVVLANIASGQEKATEKPYLVLDSGGHTALVTQVLFSERGKEVITVSQDKTIRIWDSATGQPLRTLRTPIRRGSYGMLY